MSNVREESRLSGEFSQHVHVRDDPFEHSRHIPVTVAFHNSLLHINQLVPGHDGRTIRMRLSGHL